MLWQVTVIFLNSFVTLLIGLAYAGLSKLFEPNYIVGGGGILFGLLGFYLAIKWYKLAKRLGKITAPDEL